MMIQPENAIMVIPDDYGITKKPIGMRMASKKLTKKKSNKVKKTVYIILRI